jgi:cytochrome c oxidase assembly protein subunit 15
MAFFQLGLRRTAAHLSRVPVVCGPCLRQQLPARSASRVLKLVRVARRYTSTAAEAPTQLGSLSNSITKSASSVAQTSAARTSGKTSSFPEVNDKAVGYWLIGSAVSVFGIVIWGGLTRLTESGYANRHGKVFLEVASTGN